MIHKSFAPFGALDSHFTWSHFPRQVNWGYNFHTVKNTGLFLGGMKMIDKNTIIVEIMCSVEKAFSYTTDPQNTPKWIPDIAWESRSQDNIGVGTKYKNQTIDGQTQEFVVIELKKNHKFALRRLSDEYICVYSYTQVEENITELKYEEWNPVGKDFTPMTSDYFQILKRNLETE